MITAIKAMVMRGVVRALCELQQVPQPPARGNEFTDDRPGECEPDGNLQIAEHPRRNGGYVHLSDECPPAAAKRADTLDELQVHFADAAVHGEEDQHGHQDQCQRHLRGEPDPQPDHEQRRQDDARDGVQQNHHRLEKLGEPGNQCRRESEQDAEQ